jgi:hypothetical protein
VEILFNNRRGTMVKILDIVERLSRIDNLIRNRKTGNSNELAKTIRLSRSQIFNYLDYLKDMRVEINYNKTARSYEYTDDFIPEIQSPLRIVKKSELENIEGGQNYFSRVQFYWALIGLLCCNYNLIKRLLTSIPCR